MAVSLSRLPPRARLALGLVVLAAIPFLLCVAYLDGSFMWDDLHLVRDHPLLRARDGWWRVFATELLEGAGYPKTQFYHPIPLLSLWLQYRVSDSFAALRLVNVAFHSVNVLLFAGVLERMTFRRSTAFLTAAAFAVHPLAVEPMMLVCGRHDTIAVTFALFALLVQPLRRDGSGGSRGVVWRSLAVAACTLCAFISKEAMVAATPVVFVYILVAARLGPPRKGWILAVALASPFVGLASAFAIRRSLAISAESAQAFASVWTHARNLGTLYGEYARYVLMFSHGTTTRMFVPYSMTAALAVLAIVTVVLSVMFAAALPALRARSEWTPSSRALVGLFWFLFGVGPHVVSMPVIGMWGNRYGYFPSMGLLLAVAALVEVGVDHARRPFRVAAASIVGIVITVTALNTASLAKTWRDGTTVFGYDVAQEPQNPLAHYHLGVETERFKGCEAALPEFEEAVRLQPTYWRAIHNVTGCLIRLGRYQEAIAPARRSIAQNPQSRGAAENYAAALVRSGRRKSAATVIELGLTQFPASKTLRDLATELESSQRPEDP